jgi:hypothetical protein
MGFSFRKFAARPDVTRSFELAAISEDQANPIVLVVRHAGDANPGYTSHTFKKVNRGQARGGQVTLELAQANLVDAADAYAQHVIVGWQNVVVEGKAVPCTPDTVRDFLTALIHPTEGRADVFMRLRAFCENPDNFREAIVDPAELGKK